MDKAEKLLAQCEQEERELQFEHFSRRDALDLGMQLHHRSADYGEPIAIEITVNGLVVFRYFQDGAMPDSELWLTRKRNTVDLMQMSTMHFLAWMEANGITMADRKLDADNFAAGGGGFPIVVKGTGCIGSICVSGLPDHEDDHRLLIETLTEWLSV